MATKQRSALLVTTAHKGVFFGFGEYKEGAESITLADARMCIYWPAECGGVLGLASVGPAKGSRVGPAVPSLSLNAVTSVSEVSDAAAKLWQSAPWS